MGTRTLHYNDNNRLIRVEEEADILAEYTYNGMGQRAVKVANGVTTLYHYDLTGKLIAESDEAGNMNVEYLYVGKIRVAMVDVATGSMYFYLNSKLGRPELMTDDQGVVVWEGIYKPFGEADVHPKSSVVNNFRFPGQHYDKETGLHYNYHRYYDPRTGRYLTADPFNFVGVQIAKQDLRAGPAAFLIYQYSLLNPHLTNVFLYAHSNPINLVDPFGLYLTTKQKFIVSMASGAGAIIGGLAVGFTSWGVGTPVGSAFGSALFAAAAASLLGGDLNDVGSTAISGLAAGYIGAGINNLMTAISRTGIQAAIRTGVMAGTVEAILLEAGPMLAVEEDQSPCE